MHDLAVRVVVYGHLSYSLSSPSEFKNMYSSTSPYGVRRAFTLENFKSVTFDGLWFSDFTNHQDGGVFYVENSTLTLRNCFFYSNKALQSGSGGALYAKGSNIFIDGTVFIDHTTQKNGGAIVAIQSDLEIKRSHFSGLDFAQFA